MQSGLQQDDSRSNRAGWTNSPTVWLRLVLLLTFLVYLKTITFDFVYDDHLQIVLNPWLDSWSRIPSFFTQQLWAFSDFHTPANFYRPVFLSWLSAIKLAFGGAPAWYHLLTVLVHLIVVCEVYLLANRLLRDRTTALFAAVLFAVHPTKLEAVAWISGGGEPLYAVFFFATFIAYLHGRESASRIKWTALACLFFLLASFTKEQAIVLPCILVVYEFFHRRNDPLAPRIARTLVAILPFFVVAVAYWIARLLVVHGLTDFAGQISISKTLFTQPMVWAFYLRHLVLPAGLTVMYPIMVIRDFSAAYVLVPGVIVLAVLLSACYFVRRSAEGAMLVAWFLFTMAPPAAMVLLLQPHDRYLYLPSFAFCVAIAVIVRKLLSETRHQVALMTMICLLLVVGTVLQAGQWDNDVALFERAIRQSPSNMRARIALASSYTQDGKEERALEILHEAVVVDPNNYDAWHALGVQEYSIGRYAEALPHLKTALEKTTQKYERTMCLYDLGIVAAHLRLDREAEHWLRESIALDPSSALTRKALAALLEGEGRRDEASTERLIAKQNER